MDKIKTANILLIVVLAILVITFAFQLFGKEQLTTDGSVTKSIFGLRYQGKKINPPANKPKE